MHSYAGLLNFLRMTGVTQKCTIINNCHSFQVFFELNTDDKILCVLDKLFYLFEMPEYNFCKILEQYFILHVCVYLRERSL